jgi:hypothetical protein
VKARTGPRGGSASRGVEGRRLAVRDGRRLLSTVPKRVKVVVRMQRTVLERFMSGRRRRIAAAPVDALLVRIVALAERSDKQTEMVRRHKDTTRQPNHGRMPRARSEWRHGRHREERTSLEGGAAEADLQSASGMVRKTRVPTRSRCKAAEPCLQGLDT